MTKTEKAKREQALLDIYNQLGAGTNPVTIDASLQLAIYGASKASDRLRYEFMLDALDDLVEA